MEDNEKYYDDVLTAKLAEIARLCKKKAIPFLAVIEYAPGKIGETRMQTPDECLKMVMIRHCTKTAPNVDGYIMGLAKYTRDKGIDTSGSIVMQRLMGGR